MSLPNPPALPPQWEEMFNDRAFLSSIRAYNQLFSFTSMGANIIEPANPGVPSFRIQGEVCHLIGSLLPAQGDTASYSQLYFFDTDYDTELTARAAIFEFNPYVLLYKCARARNDYKVNTSI